MEQWPELQHPLFGKDDWRIIGQEIRRRRKQKKWTQEDLAGYMNTDYRVISRHENGKGMSVETLVKYVTVFECSMESFLPKNCRKIELSGIVPSLVDTLLVVGKLPESKQLLINGIIRGTLEMGEQTL